ncbi:unnamed protein product [Protopolystoma xenopodis]|uniref:Uncharacterized protein n=1 Tax=Protopolystoma xenopodis TaxID=117903 RepID=A0A3S4ZMY1_9PLAT|nr:unnamed protein product [Protopolystoma xenopodis]
MTTTMPDDFGLVHTDLVEARLHRLRLEEAIILEAKWRDEMERTRGPVDHCSQFLNDAVCLSRQLDNSSFLLSRYSHSEADAKCKAGFRLSDYITLSGAIVD